MITGVHAIVYSAQAERLRTFFKDVLGYRFADAGHGWLIFALPPAEIAAHPCAAGEEKQELYLMCDDVYATVAALAGQGVTADPIVDQRWGLVTQLNLPSGDRIGLYQPLHPTAIGMAGA